MIKKSLKMISKDTINRYRSLALFLFFLAGVSSADFALAQTEETANPFGNRDMSAPIDIGSAYRLPGIYAINLKIEQNNNTISGSFTALNNQEDYIFGGMQYNVEIRDTYGALYQIIPSYNQIMLLPKEEKVIPFSVTINSFPAGIYNLRIQMVSNGGRLLGWADASFTITEDASNFVAISPASLVLPEFPGQVFEPLSGPNVSPAKNFGLKAILTNLGKDSITVIPQVESYDFQISRGNATVTKAESITLKPGKETVYEFPITSANDAGVYSGFLTFTDINGKPISNVGEYQWVVRGASADILPLEISQLASKKGEQFVMNLNVVGAPDAETQSKVNITAEIIDVKGVAASASVSEVTVNDSLLSTITRLNLKRDLRDDPKIVITITDANGKELVSSQIIINEESIIKNINASDKMRSLVTLIFVGGLLIIGFVFWAIKIKK